MKKLNIFRNELFAYAVSMFILGQIFSCQKAGNINMEFNKEIFGTLQDGRIAYLFTLKTADGAELRLTNYGATVISLKVPDRDGKLENVILGFKDVKDYEKNRRLYGMTIGRWGNRIAEGKFILNGKEYSLASTGGGSMGFQRLLWDYEELIYNDKPAVKFSYMSTDGGAGYPGKMNMSVIYTFSEQYELGIYYEMTTDRSTVKSVTNHSYFNLSGNVKNDILNHDLVLNADYFLPVYPKLIETGELKSVKGTPMDFTSPHKIGERINDNNEQLINGNGYDHCYVFNKKQDGMIHAGYLIDRASGRRLDLYTTEPAVQLYTGNLLDGSEIGIEGPYNFRDGVCLETRHFPDSPYQEDFPETVLNPGKEYTSTTIYKFSFN
jgi:aldose 1-epimerase